MEPSEQSFFVRLRGLPWAATRQDVVDFFSGINLCEGNTAILFTVAEGGRRSGEAVVALQTNEDLEAALARDRNYIGKRWVEVVPSTWAEFTEIMTKMTPSDNEFVVRLRGLPYAATVEDIKAFFEGLEPIENGILVVTDDQGRCGGEAYVEFADAESAQKALLRHRNKMGTRFIEVFRSTKGEMVYVGTAKATPLMSINTRNRNPDAALSGIKRSRNMRDSMGDAGFGGESPEYEIFSKYSFEKFVHMRGLPFNCTENDIVDFFAPIQVISLSMICDEAGKFTGQADAYFETDSDAIQALKRNKRRIRQRQLDLALKNRKVFVLGRLNPRPLNQSYEENAPPPHYPPPPMEPPYSYNDQPYTPPPAMYDPPMRPPPHMSNYSRPPPPPMDRPPYQSSYSENSKPFPSGYNVPGSRPLGKAPPPPQPPMYPYDNMPSGDGYVEDPPLEPNFIPTSEEATKPTNFFNYF